MGWGGAGWGGAGWGGLVQRLGRSNQRAAKFYVQLHPALDSSEARPSPPVAVDPDGVA